jgi:rSAM/selenodomain-associated transferase 1
MNDAVIIFARLPVEGKVKTRLASTLGDEFALKFYKACSQHIFNECRKIAKKETSIYITFPAEDDNKHMIEWAGNDFRFFPQHGKDIGIKMQSAFKMVFSEGIKKAILIGTDIPDISSEVLLQALKALDNNEVVIGPAKDGGFYLVGMKRLYESLFERNDWGTNKVFTGTLNQLRINNINYELTPEFYDIDTEENLKCWMSVRQVNEINPVREFVKEYNSSLKTII